MKLYEYEAFPNPRRVRMFMAEKGIDIARQQVDVPAGEHRQGEHLRRNPYGAVPTLELDDGTFISESAAICRYLEGTYCEPPLMGNTPKEQAEIEMWDRRIENTLFGAVANYFHHGTPGSGEAERYRNDGWGQHNRSAVTTEMKRLNQHLEDNEYMVGDSFSVADITTVCAIDFAGAVAIPIPVDCVNLQRWHSAVSARSSASA